MFCRIPEKVRDFLGAFDWRESCWIKLFMLLIKIILVVFSFSVNSYIVPYFLTSTLRFGDIQQYRNSAESGKKKQFPQSFNNLGFLLVRLRKLSTGV